MECPEPGIGYPGKMGVVEPAFKGRRTDRRSALGFAGRPGSAAPSGPRLGGGDYRPEIPPAMASSTRPVSDRSSNTTSAPASRSSRVVCLPVATATVHTPRD